LSHLASPYFTVFFICIGLSVSLKFSSDSILHEPVLGHRGGLGAREPVKSAFCFTVFTMEGREPWGLKSMLKPSLFFWFMTFECLRPSKNFTHRFLKLSIIKTLKYTKIEKNRIVNVHVSIPQA
jgi:hypothetical protein